MRDFRLKFTLITSTDKPQDPSFGLFKLRAAELVSNIAGGCTVYNALGYWSEEAAEAKEQYGGVQSESAFVLEVSVLQDQGGTGYWLDRIQQAYAKAKQETGASIRWIHCEKSSFTAKHFEI